MDSFLPMMSPHASNASSSSFLEQTEGSHEDSSSGCDDTRFRNLHMQLRQDMLGSAVSPLVSYFAVVVGASMMDCSPARRPKLLRFHCIVASYYLLAYCLAYLVCELVFPSPLLQDGSISIVDLIIFLVLPFLAQAALGFAVAAGLLYAGFVRGVMVGPPPRHSLVSAAEYEEEEGDMEYERRLQSGVI